jgi:hypothetical protein
VDREVVPLCECHGEGMKWNVDKRMRAGGWWHCRERYRESNRRASRGYYHRKDGGYIRRRKRDLQAERARIEAALKELA